MEVVFTAILRSLSLNTPIVRGAITLLNRDTGEIMIESGYGMTAEQKRRGRYHMGEGVTGQVVKSNSNVVIPDISKDSRYMNKTGAMAGDAWGDPSQRISFISIPIHSASETIGKLNISFRNLQDEELASYEKLLAVVASMLSRTVRIRQELREEHERLELENSWLKKELSERFTPNRIIGKSLGMQELYELIEQVSKSEATVMIRGESGTGKELVAQEIHENSLRSYQPFVKVSCAALPESIIESELFGHERGAFTGAHTQRIGRFELANGGTLFLDEVGEISTCIQSKLLRVLQ